MLAVPVLLTVAEAVRSGGGEEQDRLRSLHWENWPLEVGRGQRGGTHCLVLQYPFFRPLKGIEQDPLPINLLTLCRDGDYLPAGFPIKQNLPIIRTK